MSRLEFGAHVACPSCKGLGTMPGDLVGPVAPGHRRQRERVTCRSCDGRGYVANGPVRSAPPDGWAG